MVTKELSPHICINILQPNFCFYNESLNYVPLNGLEKHMKFYLLNIFFIHVITSIDNSDQKIMEADC